MKTFKEFLFFCKQLIAFLNRNDYFCGSLQTEDCKQGAVVDNMKVILPVAGKGTRLKPFTLHKPKSLLPVGGKPILDWIVEATLSLDVSERIFVTGYKAECVEEYLKTRDWGTIRTVFQSDPQGLGEAVSLCLPYLDDDEPVLIILGDTLFKADLSSLETSGTNALVTLRVNDPDRFGVAVKDSNGEITRLVEKPKEFVSDEALIGIYYIRDVAALRNALGRIIREDIRIRGEYQLTDALQLMIESGCRFTTSPAVSWLDCGLPATLLKTNAAVLPYSDNSGEHDYPGSRITPPCHIGRNVRIANSKVGPYVSIGDGCEVIDSCVANSILWDGVRLQRSQLENRIIAGEDIYVIAGGLMKAEGMVHP
jgi:NDP-sugar pyrophosphorylase family protein